MQPFDFTPYGGLIRPLTPSEVWHAPDIGGSRAIADAVTALRNGETVRFARLRYQNREWKLVNVARFAVCPENDQDRIANGYGPMIRISDHDGPVDAEGSHAIGLYDIDKHSDAEIAVHLVCYLIADDCDHARLAVQQAEALPRCSQCNDAPVDDDDQLCEDCEDQNELARRADILQDDLKHQ